MTDWKPIETAPKDRSEILVATSDGDICIAQYEMSARPPFWSSDYLDLMPGGHEIDPTYWMPVTAPPE